MFTASMTIYTNDQNSFFLLADENITHLKRKIYALSNTILFQCVNVSKISVEVSTGEKIDYIDKERLSEEDKQNAILEWYKP